MIKLPIKFKITKKIIEEGKKNIYKTHKCIGALALEAAIKDTAYSTRWGCVSGIIFREGYESIQITTLENIDLMEIKKPQEVTFIKNK